MKPESNMIQQDRKGPPELITSVGTGHRPLDRTLTQLRMEMQHVDYPQRVEIATAAMQGLLAHYGGANPEAIAKMAVKNAGALIAKPGDQKEENGKVSPGIAILDIEPSHTTK